MEHTALPNILLGTKILIFFFLCPCLVSVCSFKVCCLGSMHALPGEYQASNAQSTFQTLLFKHNAISLTADHCYGPLVPNQGSIPFSINCIRGSDFQLNEKVAEVAEIFSLSENPFAFPLFNCKLKICFNHWELKTQ